MKRYGKSAEQGYQILQALLSLKEGETLAYVTTEGTKIFKYEGLAKKSEPLIWIDECKDISEEAWEELKIPSSVGYVIYTGGAPEPFKVGESEEDDET